MIFLFVEALFFLKSRTGTPSFVLVMPRKVSSNPRMKTGGPYGVAGASVLLDGEKLINFAL
jgi:hypothetical protein|tara:strand:+ start:733 stop:915 length:183 start_codon:yes stop_codon:yes gene_type:complete